MARDFEFIEKQMRKKTYGIIGTVDEKNRSHTTGILYGVSHPGDTFAVYVVTGAEYKKTRNIRLNHNVSFAIPFPHHVLSFIPASTISFQGTAEVLPIDDEAAVRSFSSKWILRENVKTGLEGAFDVVFLRIRPDKKIHVYGVGVSMMKMMRNPQLAAYSVQVPEKRL